MLKGANEANLMMTIVHDYSRPWSKVCASHLYEACKPCVIGELPSQTYGNVIGILQWYMAVDWKVSNTVKDGLYSQTWFIHKKSIKIPIDHCFSMKSRLRSVQKDTSRAIEIKLMFWTFTLFWQKVQNISLISIALELSEHFSDVTSCWYSDVLIFWHFSCEWIMSDCFSWEAYGVFNRQKHNFYLQPEEPSQFQSFTMENQQRWGSHELWPISSLRNICIFNIMAKLLPLYNLMTYNSFLNEVYIYNHGKQRWGPYLQVGQWGFNM